MVKTEAPKAWIINIGNEILIGRTLNTNSQWLAKKLTFLGFRVERIIVIPDSIYDISEEVARGLSRAKVIITTGGLGPTYDDITLDGIAEALGVPKEVNPEALAMVKRFYEAMGERLTEHRVKMAIMPRGCKPLRNPVGAAPGCLITIDGGRRMIVSLPGVPREMEAMFESEVEPILMEIAPPLALAEERIVSIGVPESSIAPILDNAAKLSPNVYVKSHPEGHEARGPKVRIVVLASAASRDEAKREAKRILGHIIEGLRRLGAEIIAEKGNS